MYCYGCRKPKNLDVQASFGTIEFGLLRRTPDGFTAIFEKIGFPVLSFNWHRRGPDVTERSFCVEFDNDHPNQPKPDIIPTQAEFYFCSIACMRSWLARVMDWLDDMVNDKITVEDSRENPVL